MWPRVVELMLGVWLIISPFLFRHPTNDLFLWSNDIGCGFLVICFSCFSFWRRTHWAHFGTLVVALWLLGYAYLASSFPADHALQNELLVGLLLAMFAIIPNEADRPPLSWRRISSEVSGGPG